MEATVAERAKQIATLEYDLIASRDALRDAEGALEFEKGQNAKLRDEVGTTWEACLADMRVAIASEKAMMEAEHQAECEQLRAELPRRRGAGRGRACACKGGEAGTSAPGVCLLLASCEGTRMARMGQQGSPLFVQHRLP